VLVAIQYQETNNTIPFQLITKAIIWVTWRLLFNLQQASVLQPKGIYRLEAKLVLHLAGARVTILRSADLENSFLAMLRVVHQAKGCLSA